ncbi:MAG TPA: hypothetical protein VHY08_19925 [Bacillota bacterium]|nr:hypothetical protein [Bacillota bacterium]
MDNLFIKYGNAVNKLDSFTGLKCYQKVKEVLVEFDVKHNEEMAKIPGSEGDSTFNLNQATPESRRHFFLDTGLNVNKLV